mmetsp:Transcript_136/g.481  ORF Transcript_136/g.481 Transcript_136/m.481 type:complete len:203 (-) Transcript_136:1800-2408(-)
MVCSASPARANIMLVALNEGAAFPTICLNSSKETLPLMSVSACSIMGTKWCLSILKPLERKPVRISSRVNSPFPSLSSFLNISAASSWDGVPLSPRRHSSASAHQDNGPPTKRLAAANNGPNQNTETSSLSNTYPGNKGNTTRNASAMLIPITKRGQASKRLDLKLPLFHTRPRSRQFETKSPTNARATRRKHKGLLLPNAA